jgi:hypothetical protein
MQDMFVTFREYSPVRDALLPLAGFVGICFPGSSSPMFSSQGSLQRVTTELSQGVSLDHVHETLFLAEK